MTAAARLARSAEQLRPHLPPDRLRMLDDALARARTGRTRVLVLGEAKRGKSTLVNALFGRALLPTGALPATSVAAVVTVASTVDAEVRYRGGERRRVDLAEAAELASERGNPSNEKNVDTVRITAPSPYLPEGAEVVDSPGTGSVHQANTDEAARARGTVDLAVLVVAADPPVSQAELALAEEVTATAAATVVVVNKIDLVREEDLGEIVAFTRSAVTARLGAGVPVLPLSLRTSAPDELAGWLAERIARHGGSDVVASTARALRRETSAVLDGLKTECELLSRTADDSARAVAALREIFDNAHGAEAAAIDHLRGEARRARPRLDASHERAVTAARAAAERLLGTDLPVSPERPEDLADTARKQVAERAIESCAGWFHHVGGELETTVRRAAGQAVSGLTADLARARHAAAGVLEIQLADAPAPEPVAAPRLPVLELAPEVVWRELVTTALAHRMPRAVRRKRLHRHLVEWAGNAVPRPYGRARSALQDWLREAGLANERAIAEIWSAQLAALETGLEEADRARAGEPSARLAHVRERIEELERTIRDLDEMLSTVPAR
ncbi:dynamin family protein [Amycolatopsis sp. A1MSW2902]|uniref:dynamin family protein n=1 Tax=Amycolatopsis sp. A1MSW2902 TaxID=687413 RepID=UPI00307E8B88